MNVINEEHYNFGGHEIRVVCDGDDKPWFVAGDVSSTLEYSRTADMLRMTRDNERTQLVMETGGGSQTVTLINEPGLYRAVFNSRAEAAEKFQDWVYHEVLPTIRKQGYYAAKQSSLAKATEEGNRVIEDVSIYGTLHPRTGFPSNYHATRMSVRDLTRSLGLPEQWTDSGMMTPLAAMTLLNVLKHQAQYKSGTHQKLIRSMIHNISQDFDLAKQV
ncbi:MAG: BRO-N domain-containing protein [Luminiphilus sp.]